MSGRRVFVSNFEFEWSLGRPAGSAMPQSLRRMVQELAFAWLAIAEPDDQLLMSCDISPDDWDDLQHQFPRTLPERIRRLAEAASDAEIVPWAWTPGIETDWSTLGRPLPLHPDSEAVRRVNSREFSTNLELSLSAAPRYSDFVHSREELEEHLRRAEEAAAFPEGWLLKANHSNAGRDRLQGSGRALTSRQLAWLDRQWSQGRGVAIEPCLQIESEAGIEWDVPLAGPPRLVGIAPLLTDGSGQYRGSLFAHEGAWEDDWAEAVVVARRAAMAVQAAGYFGPLGIDASWYRDTSGERCCRPIQDINARWTMGRLALGWRDLLSPGESGVWTQGACAPAEAIDCGRSFELTPLQLDGRPIRHRQRVLIRRDAQWLDNPVTT